MPHYPMSAVLDDLKLNRKALIETMMGQDGFDPDKVRELAALQGAIAAVEAQIEEDSPYPSDDRIEQTIRTRIHERC